MNFLCKKKLSYFAYLAPLFVFRIVAKFSFYVKFGVTNCKVTPDREFMAESLKVRTIYESLKWKAIEYVNNFP